VRLFVLMLHDVGKAVWLILVAWDDRGRAVMCPARIIATSSERVPKVMHDFEQLDYYELLDVSRAASLEEIKRAYRRQVSRYHPDHNIGKPPEELAYASQRTQRINEAYRVLSDAQARRAYNRGDPMPTSDARRMATPGTAGVSRARGEGRTQAAPRDYQAELYEQAQAHLKAGRRMQAIATLRELQQINPFYRDSATLLARAEAAEPGKGEPAAAGAAGMAGGNDAHASRAKKWLAYGGGGVVIVLGVAAALFAVPRFQAEGMTALAPTSTPTVVATSTEAPTSTEARPTATAVSPVIVLEPTPTDTPEPADTDTPAPPTTTFTPEPTVTNTPVPPTLTPVPPTLTPVPPTLTPVPPTLTPVPPPTAIPASPTAVIAEQLPEEPAPVPAGDGVVFTDDFSTNTGWAVQSTNLWSVGYGNGYYRITATPGIGNIWSFRTAYGAPGDFSLAADVQVVSGEGGLVMRYLDAQNYLAFLVDPANGSYRLQQWSGGALSILAEGQSGAIQPGAQAINRLEARLQGAQVQLFINDQPVGEATASGVVQTQTYGMVAVANTVPLAEVLFDNLVIRALP
jgi:hypothetical protein